MTDTAEPLRPLRGVGVLASQQAINGAPVATGSLDRLAKIADQIADHVMALEKLRDIIRGTTIDAPTLPKEKAAKGLPPLIDSIERTLQYAAKLRQDIAEIF